jgi:hypothetical protein
MVLNAVRRIVPSSFAFGAAAMLAACTNMATPDFGGPGLFAAQIPFLVPAKNSAASSIRAFSVVPVGNPFSQFLARDLEGQMVGLKYQEQPYYSRVTLNPPVAAMILPLPALQGIAQRDQTTGVISIGYGGQRLDHRNYQETRTECSQKVGFLKACPKGAERNTQVSCEERKATVSADLRIYELRQNRVVYSDTLSDTAVNARCSDAFDAKPSDNDVIAMAVGALQKKILPAFAPTVQQRPLDMMEPDAAVGATDAAAPARFQEALQFARGRRLDESCNRFAELYDGNKESAALTYNMGFCDEARGDLINADSLYHRASELARVPNSTIDRHLNAVQRQIKETGLVALPTRTNASPAATGAFAAVNDGGRRVALVVGNAHYKRGALNNPINDARLVQAQLTRLGFEVTEVEDVTSARFQSVIKDFINKSKGATVALFYYAGHAIQVDGENLLLPVDNSAMRSISDVRDHAVVLGVVLAQLDVAAPKVKLVVLDACRDNPLPGETRSLTGGLAPIRTPPAGSLIAFATSPGQTAVDGSGKNSVFTKYFVREIQNPNQKLEDVFKKVRAEVQRETQDRQKPTEVSSLTGDFYFRPAAR